MSQLQAQPTLPNIECVQEGSTVRLMWTCQYEGVKGIVVNRSYDSLKNYSQIGTVANVEKGIQTFVDERPLAGRSFYKVVVIFRSGLNWSSNHCGFMMNGSIINDTAGEMKGEAVVPRIKFKLTIPEPDPDAVYTDPIHVRNNKTTGHLDVRLPTDHSMHYWSLVFYDQKKQAVLSIPLVKARNVVIDKRNFRRRGVYKFELRRDGVVFEWGYVTVN